MCDIIIILRLYGIVLCSANICHIALTTILYTYISFDFSPEQYYTVVATVPQSGEFWHCAMLPVAG